MIGFDPIYLVFVGPAMLLAMWAQWRVQSTFGEYRQISTVRGLSGAQVAAAILRAEGVGGVRIEPVDGFLSDHYDPTTRTLRLSPDVYAGTSIAAAGVAAHEVGHALQHAQAYPWLTMRSNLVPVLNITNTLAMPTLFGGLVLSMFSSLGLVVLLLGIVLFGAMVLFQIVTLPVEIDASRRAVASLETHRLMRGEELDGARAVLNAAAWTYVAAAISSIATLAYYLFQFWALQDRRD